MLNSTIEKAYNYLLKYNILSLKLSSILLIGIVTNLNITGVSAQSNNIAIDKNSLAQPLTIRGVSGGAIAALEITQTQNTSTGFCDGFADRQPNHILKIDTFFDYLRIEVESSADTTILIRGAGGVWCNDDAGTANPVIEGQWKPGVYQVWVGSYQANSNNDYQIKITTR